MPKAKAPKIIPRSTMHMRKGPEDGYLTSPTGAHTWGREYLEVDIFTPVPSMYNLNENRFPCKMHAQMHSSFPRNIHAQMQANAHLIPRNMHSSIPSECHIILTPARLSPPNSTEIEPAAQHCTRQHFFFRGLASILAEH